MEGRAPWDGLRDLERMEMLNKNHTVGDRKGDVPGFSFYLEITMSPYLSSRRKTIEGVASLNTVVLFEWSFQLWHEVPAAGDRTRCVTKRELKRLRNMISRCVSFLGKYLQYLKPMDCEYSTWLGPWKYISHSPYCVSRMVRITWVMISDSSGI